MKLLIIEDDISKSEQVLALVREVTPDAQIELSKSLSDAVRVMEKIQFNLIILDFMLPMNESSPPTDCSVEILNIVKRSSRNYSACLVALTAYDELISNVETEFSKSGVIICNYSAFDQSWKLTIRSLVQRHSILSSRRFIIVCALEAEREAFAHTAAEIESPQSISGLDACNIKIGGELGVIVLCPRMGLVNASIVTAIAIERFTPEIVCMAGICAGISNKTHIGQVLVADPCFEYQVGKFTPTRFQIEQYHVNLNESLRQVINGLKADDDFVASLYYGVVSSDIVPSPPQLCTFVSGSAVVADEIVVAKIIDQHRKLAGLDMETFGVMQAAALSNCNVKVFSAKAVVDHADSAKTDKNQSEGCKISARYCVAAISRLLGPVRQTGGT